jgi:hypothetical protein
MCCWPISPLAAFFCSVKIVEILHRLEEERNILPHAIKRRKTNWMGHSSRTNWLIKLIIEGKIEERIEMTGRRGRRRNQLMDDFKEARGFWKLKKH